MSPKFELPQCETCEPRLRSIFGELTGDELNMLSLHKGCNFHKAGQVLFYERNYPAGLFCVNKGKIKLYKTGEDGKDQIVRLAKEGDVLGYRALVSGEPYAASAAVLEDAAVCFIPKQSFYNLLQHDVSFMMRIMKLLSRDVAVAEQKELSLARKPVRERVAEALLMLKEFYGSEEDGATIKGSMSREDLANIVGTATESVIRLLSEFKQDNIIDLQQKKIKILNKQALTNIARIYD